MKNTLEEINRLNETDKWISELEYRVVEITTTKQKKGNEDSLKDFWDNIIPTYWHYKGPRKRREKEPEKIYEEIIAETFSNLRKEGHPSLGSRVPYRINP